MREAEQALRFLTDEVRTLHEAVVLDRCALEHRAGPGVVVAGRASLLGSDGSSIFLLGEDGSLRRIAGVGVPDPEGVDDLIAAGDRRPAAVVQAEVAPAAPAEPSAGRRGEPDERGRSPLP